jgi:hypothetical protein
MKGKDGRLIVPTKLCWFSVLGIDGDDPSLGGLSCEMFSRGANGLAQVFVRGDIVAVENRARSVARDRDTNAPLKARAGRAISGRCATNVP